MFTVRGYVISLAAIALVTMPILYWNWSKEYQRRAFFTQSPLLQNLPEGLDEPPVGAPRAHPTCSRGRDGALYQKASVELTRRLQELFAEGTPGKQIEATLTQQGFLPVWTSPDISFEYYREKFRTQGWPGMTEDQRLNEDTEAFAKLKAASIRMFKSRERAMFDQMYYNIAWELDANGAIPHIHGCVASAYLGP